MVGDRKEIEVETGESWGEVRPVIEAAGYSLSQREGGDCVEDFPHGAPLLVEIMTCSTSGGNKDKRTTIPMAFEDAALGKSHDAPGINYRQVWARMVSQLVGKSEVAMAWGGNAFWILQYVLLDYISRSTSLDLHQFLTERASEVNILSFSYGSDLAGGRGIWR